MCSALFRSVRTYTERQVLHHVAHTTKSGHRILTFLTPSSEQVLYATIGINLHSAQVVKAVDKSRIFAELLVERI